MTTRDAQLIRTEQWEWVQAVEEAQELIHSSRDKLPLFVDPLPLHDIIAKVERFVNAAADAVVASASSVSATRAAGNSPAAILQKMQLGSLIGSSVPVPLGPSCVC